MALLLDSDAPRPTDKRCGRLAASASDRAADAEGAYRYLAGTGLAAADRVGLIGWSEGASGAMAAVDASKAPAGTGLFKVAVAFQPDCTLDDAFGGVAHSTWRPAASVRVLQGTSGSGAEDWSRIQRIGRAQQLGAPSVTLVTRTGFRPRMNTAEARQVAESEVLDLLRGTLQN